jgi:hypothetical protein
MFKQSAFALMLFVPMLSFANQGTLNAGPGDPVLPANGVWQGDFDEFIGGAGGFFNESWDIVGPTQVQITDIYVPGDEFNIYDNGVLVGSSSAVADWNTYEANAYASPPYTGDPGTAWASPAFSHYEGDFVAGDVITIQEAVEPSGFTDSTYSIRGVAAPDSPAGILGVLAIGSVLVIGGRARRMA